jgi:phage gpG-like protein
MDLTLQYSDGGVEESLNLAIDALSDLTPIFNRFMAWLRPEIDKVFQQQGPGWPERKESSEAEHKRTLPAKIAEIRARALNPLQRSVLRSYRRAEKRLGKTSSTSDLYAKRQKTLAKQKRQADEIKRINAGGAVGVEKEFSKLGQRVQKYRDTAEGKVAALERGELLGRIANSIRALVNGNVLTIESMIDWAGVHNDGGVAGKGARIPERKFLEWTPERLAKFVEIAQQYVIEKLEKKKAQ